MPGGGVMAMIESEGPLQGRAVITILLSKQSTEWLQHAASRLDRDLDELAQTAVEESALNWAKSSDLLNIAGD